MEPLGSQCFPYGGTFGYQMDIWVSDRIHRTKPKIIIIFHSQDSLNTHMLSISLTPSFWTVMICTPILPVWYPVFVILIIQKVYVVCLITPLMLSSISWPWSAVIQNLKHQCYTNRTVPNWLILPCQGFKCN